MNVFNALRTTAPDAVIFVVVLSPTVTVAEVVSLLIAVDPLAPKAEALTEFELGA